jgi:hypothetical protein
MSGLEILLGVAGVLVTVLVIAGMVLLTPRGVVEVHGKATDSQGSELSRAGAADRPAPVVTSP